MLLSMSYFCINEDKDEPTIPLDMNELYEKQHKRDMKQLSIYNKLLSRIHQAFSKTYIRVKRMKHLFLQRPRIHIWKVHAI